MRFYYDVVCPYAYLATTQLDRMFPGVEIEWIPILLGGLLRDIGGPVDPNAEMPAAKARLVSRDYARWAELLGVPLSKPDSHPQRTVEAMRLLCMVEPGDRRSASADLYRAYWVDGRDPADPELLTSVARNYGLPPDAIGSDQARRQLRANTARAEADGVFGVPSFGIGETIWWGQDRMWLVARQLGLSTDDPTAPPAHFEGPAPRRVSFFHDFSSPFSYLASTQVGRIADAAGVDIEWTPFLLGGLFRSIGTPDVPLFEMTERKQRYLRRDLADWADAYGVPFRFPDHFPMMSILPLRAALVEPDAVPAIYRAAWGDNRRVDTPDALGAVLTQAGFPAEEILGRTQDPAIKSRLKANGQAAEAAGVCGAPSFVVQWDDSRPLVIWGQDRLGVLSAALRGFHPTVG